MRFLPVFRFSGFGDCTANLSTVMSDGNLRYYRNSLPAVLHGLRLFGKEMGFIVLWSSTSRPHAHLWRSVVPSLSATTLYRIPHMHFQNVTEDTHSTSEEESRL